MVGKAALARLLAAAVLSGLALPALASAETIKSGPVTYTAEETTLSIGATALTSAFCPADRPVSGGGAGVDGPTDAFEDVDIASFQPIDDGDPGSTPDDGWRGDADSEDSVAHTFRVTAICVKPSAATISRASFESSIGMGTFTSVSSAACPSGTVTGAGFDTTAANPSLVELEELGHSFASDEPIYTSVQSAFGKEGAAIDHTTFALCSTASINHRHKGEVVYPGLSSLKAKCPKGARVLGGGFSRFPIDLIASEPFDSGDPDEAPDDGWKVKARYSGPAAGFAYAHCLK